MANFPKHRLLLTNVRLSYCKIAEPRPERTNDDGSVSPASYGTQIIIQKGSAAHKLVQQTINKILLNDVCNGDKAKAQKALKAPSLKKGLRDPDQETDDIFERAEYQGAVFMNANSLASYSRPGVCLKNGSKLQHPDEIAQHIYSGCYANLSVGMQFFSRKDGGKGIAVYLNNVMKERDGDRLDGSVDAADEFADLIDPNADVGEGLGAGDSMNSDDPFADDDDLLGGGDDDPFADDDDLGL